MKEVFYLQYIFLVITLFLSSCDRSDDEGENGAASLPPITETGAGTFGCLINGNVFVHTDGGLNCYYQFVDGGYYFGIQGRNEDEAPISIILSTEQKSLSENETLTLLSHQAGHATGGAFFKISPTDGTHTFTNEQYEGELTIIHFDIQNRIVSGTFWFDIKHPVTGERVEIREGRFDAHFMQ